MSTVNRRNFLKASGVAVLPALLPAIPAMANDRANSENPAGEPVVRFFYDGAGFDAASNLEALQSIHAREPIKRDFYGQGGVVEAMEKKFAEITGKEKAIYMPTGTMANQLAIAVLSGEKTKVFVQDTSHIYRDEADAAQSVFQKRLMPLAPGQTYFTAQQLQEGIDSLKELEVFPSGVGCVAIENPVRRTDGRMVPMEEIKKISAYCREKGIGLHLDGARIYMASAWSGLRIKEYAAYFDTVYISLYKYLGAGSGAVLCGDKSVIDKMPHLIKIHGGTTFSGWPNAAVALSKLDTIEDSLNAAVERSAEVFAGLNRLPGVSVRSLDGGTNIYELELDKKIDGKKMQETLNRDFRVQIPPPNEKNMAHLTVNETILLRGADYIVQAFGKAIKS